MQTIVIIGASHAAAQLAASLRPDGWQGEIVVIGDEPYLPYHRPPLSKTFLCGAQKTEFDAKMKVAYILFLFASQYLGSECTRTLDFFC